VPGRLVQIPRHLLHIGFEDLGQFDVPEPKQAALRALLADLPLGPDASSSAQLVGPPEVCLPCLAVLARHVGQGLRDHNLSIAHDPTRLRVERHKLIFVDTATLLAALADGDTRLRSESVLFASNAEPELVGLLSARESAGLASFVATSRPLAALRHWRQV
jgi:hypothetical protein